ncbi:hypothetical protein JT321_gp12 [Providencia phage Kokobel1]|uniref:Uncharacterized protein n=1 Tax=Providencia phage Kokobel1 TaxID=2783540 RepID=A0A873WLU9_9CAUD|nr:hypothetical protein JT321_gp12 [Providencia phage Kokobel1]QPB11439.1 hypothetical protein [Providencia phage Kokobel1]
MAIAISPLMVESFQQFEIGDYPYGNWTYPDNEVGNRWRPEKLINHPADKFIFNWTTPQGTRVGESRSYYHTWVRSGPINFESTIRPSVGTPFGYNSDTAFNVQEFAGGNYGDRNPLGVSIVPCPTRPGRKRLSLPGNKMPGRYSHTTTVNEIDANSLTIGFRFGVDSFSSDIVGCLSFVVRFPKRSLSSTVNSEWCVIVGRDNAQPSTPQGSNYGFFNMITGSHQPWATFGCGRVIQVTSATGEIGWEQTLPDSLPWAFFGHPRNAYASNVSIPNPNVAGPQGQFYKFEFDRDYHIELRIEPGSSVIDRCYVTAWVDGELVANGVISYGTSDTVNGLSAVQMPNAGYYRSHNRGFAISHSVANRNGVKLTPELFESLGKILISDIVYGAQSKASNNVFGPSTRVWGEMPNTDVDVQFKNNTGEGTNASVVGTPLSSSAVDPNRELHGVPGTSDTYKTEGSSMPDFAGSVQYIMSTALVRTEGASVDAEATIECGENMGSTTIQPSTSNRYVRLDGINNPNAPMSPAAAAELTYGVKIEGS